MAIDLIEICHTEAITIDQNFNKWGQKTNPLDKSGNISCCAMCQSIYHWHNDCPNKVKEDSSNNVKITLFTQDVHSCYIEKFVGEGTLMQIWKYPYTFVFV